MLRAYQRSAEVPWGSLWSICRWCLSF